MRRSDLPPPPALPPGRRAGRFELDALLGEGATALVFAARDGGSGRTVAVKLPRDADEPVQSAHLLREGRIAMEVKHRDVAEVHEVIDAPDGALLAMELVRGRTLRQRLNEPGAGAGALSRGEVLRIGRHVCSGLAAVHRAGIVHRDVKPENVLLSGAGEVKLIDFGIARRWRLADAPPPSTNPRIRLRGDEPTAFPGTFGYMAPEQGRGEPPDPRADIFSLGVMLYEMFTGVRPFSRPSPHHVWLAVERDDPEPPSRRRPSPIQRFNRILDQVLLRCLEKDPQRRYPDMVALLYDLQALSRLASGE